MTAPDPTGGLGYSDIIKQYLGQWGLSSLAPLVDSLGKTGASSDEIYLKLQDSPEWHTRFAGNDQRIKAGLGPLSPADYIALEGSYRQVLNQYGIPAGFYDDKASTDGWIGGDVSASEIASRVQMASDAYLNAPQEFRDSWDQYYGQHGAGGAIASILDTKVAQPILEQQVTAAGIGGVARQNGLLTGQDQAMNLAQNGVTIQQARQAYSQIGQRLSTDAAVSSRFSSAGVGAIDQTTEENATLLGAADAQRRQALGYAEEAAQFSGHGGADATSGNSGTNY